MTRSSEPDTERALRLDRTVTTAALTYYIRKGRYVRIVPSPLRSLTIYGKGATSAAPLVALKPAAPPLSGCSAPRLHVYR